MRLRGTVRVVVECVERGIEGARAREGCLARPPCKHPVPT